jgi:hypothetical protein
MHVLVLASFFTDRLCIFKGGGGGCIFLVEGVQGWMETTMTTEKKRSSLPEGITTCHRAHRLGTRTSIRS